jgi:hypothetical protein
MVGDQISFNSRNHRWIGIALVSGLAGIVQAIPAHALGGSLTISQNGGVTTVDITGAIITSKSGNLLNVSSPLSIQFVLAGGTTADTWANLGIPEYAFGSIAGGDGKAIYTDLAGDILSNNFKPANADLSSLEVFSNGLLKFEIASSVSLPPNDCYTGKEYISATGSAACGKFLNSFSLTVPTGKTGFVPNSDPGAPYPSVASLLANFTGTYTGATGAMSSGGGEGQVTYTLQEVPAPLPLFGAGTAFAFSRRLRKRIAQNKAQCSRRVNLNAI